MAIRSRLNGILKRCGLLLNQHYFNIDYSYSEELNPYRLPYKQFYNLLELDSCVDLDYRLDQLIIAQREEGSNKSKLKKLTRMQVIELSPELHDTALYIAEQLLRRYEAQVFAVNIDLNTLEDEGDELI